MADENRPSKLKKVSVGPVQTLSKLTALRLKKFRNSRISLPLSSGSDEILSPPR